MDLIEVGGISMFFSSKKKLAFTYTDYKIQFFRFVDKDVAKGEVIEAPLVDGTVREGLIVDEIVFFDTLKEMVKINHLKGHSVIYTVPDHAVTMRNVEHPEDLHNQSLKEYFELEIGETIHLPFDEPVIDVYDPNPEDQHAILFASNGIEVIKMQQLLNDAGLKPIGADIKSLANLRLAEQIFPSLEDQTTMVVSTLINEMSLSIFSKGHLEFLRFQSIETELTQWQLNETENGFTYTYNRNLADYKMNLMEALAEIGRIMNFYRFSVSKDQRQIEQIILMGDCPENQYIYDMLSSQFELPVFKLDDLKLKQYYPNFNAGHAELLGLALRADPFTQVPLINLMPPLRSARSSNKIGIWAAAILGVLFIAGVAVWNYSLSTDVADLQKENEAKVAALDEANSQLEQLQSSDGDSLEDAVKTIEQLSYPVTPIIAAVNKNLADYNYKTNYEFAETSAKAVIQYETYSELANYIEKIQMNPIFKDVKVNTINTKKPGNENEEVQLEETIDRHIAEIELDLNLPALQEERND